MSFAGPAAYNHHGMKRRASPHAGLVLLLVALSVTVAPGCVHRVLLVRTEPSGADVYINGQKVGRSPVEHEFHFYLPMDIEVRKYNAREGGYRAVHRVKDPKIPWHQHFPLDLLTEFLVPWPIRDVHEVDIPLERETRTFSTPADEEELERKIEAIRQSFVSSRDDP